MTCAHCGNLIDADSAFCRFCGGPAVVASREPRKLYRHSARGRIAGVCAGLADYLNADVTLVRLVWVVLSIVPGGFVGGLVAYLAAWILMTDASQSTASNEAQKRRLIRSVGDRRIGGVCGGIAEYLSVDSTLIRVAWTVLAIVPGAVVLGVVAYLVAWFIMPAGRRDVMAAAPSAA